MPTFLQFDQQIGNNQLFNPKLWEPEQLRGVMLCLIGCCCDAEDSSVDAAIFCLALMGTDYGTFLKEASRVMKPGGLLWIAEVRSRFADSSMVEPNSKNAFAGFVVALEKLGMHVTRQDSSNKMFVVFEAKKVADRNGLSDSVLWPELKPCMYKKR